jgi:3',5'-cyclic AMP phosphodiesterase CpdA
MLLYLILFFINNFTLYLSSFFLFHLNFSPFSPSPFHIISSKNNISCYFRREGEGGGAYVDTRAFCRTNVNCLFTYKCRKWVGVCCSCVTWVNWCLDCFGRWRTVYNVAGGPGWAVVPSVYSVFQFQSGARQNLGFAAVQPGTGYRTQGWICPDGEAGHGGPVRPM